MNKLLYTLSFILTILSISILGYKVVSANSSIEKTKDIIEIQKEKEKYLTPYGYTVDNPNIVLNPYGNSPLTALILFETEKDEEITIKIKEKDGTIKITNKFKKNTKHYLPIYGLYPDYENEIIIQYGNKIKNIKIKTTPLPNDLTKEPVINNTNDLSFLNTNGYIYALDSNNEIRWYLTEKYQYNITKLSNGNFIIPTSYLNNNDYPLGITEIDLLGKIYKQYNIENGYYGSYIEKETSYLILSKNLIEIDKQTGHIIKEIKLENTYDTITFNQVNNIIELQNETETLIINLKKNEKKQMKTEKLIIQKELISPIYTIDNYILTKGIAFKIDSPTKESKEKILLIGYKNIDDNYKKYNIKITNSTDYIKITGDFSDNDKVYLILDKFLDKRVYDINYNCNLIKPYNLKGKYSIYLKINDIIYKTDKYIQK